MGVEGVGVPDITHLLFRMQTHVKPSADVEDSLSMVVVTLRKSIMCASSMCPYSMCFEDLMCQMFIHSRMLPCFFDMIALQGG